MVGFFASSASVEPHCTSCQAQPCLLDASGIAGPNSHTTDWLLALQKKRVETTGYIEIMKGDKSG